IVKNGSRWRIGDGADIDVWSQPWIQDNDNFLVTTPFDDSLRDVTVQDLAIPGLAEWDGEHILAIFNDMDATLDLSLPPPRSNRPNKLIWHFNRNGDYTVRSAYRVAMEQVWNREHLHVLGEWSSLWRIKLSPKIKQFCWRLGRGAISTRQALDVRGIRISVECGCCAVAEESDWHLFLDCPIVAGCWLKAGLTSMIRTSMAGKSSIREWLLSVIVGSPEAIVQKVIVINWSVWKESNNRVWSNKSSEPEWIIKQGLDELYDWLKAQDKPNETAPSRTIECDKWHRPESGTLSCNVDAAIFDNERRSGVGMIVRNTMGEMVKYRMNSWSGC
ncbi:Putative ribonuclease H protein At1g65750, partial [Linum perenne]